MILLDDLLCGAASLGAHTHGPVFARRFDGLAYDSRALRPGDLFVAVPTERFDGHDFLLAACRSGAAGVLCERPQEFGELGVTCIVVSDVRAALIAWAGYLLTRQQLDVIAVTGSLGKTSTQAAIVRALGSGDDDQGIFHNGNRNDLFGLPIALGELEPSHAVAVLELASDRPGEMRALAGIARPRTAVVTNVAPVHSESLGGLSGIAAEHGMLMESLPEDGWAVLNGDDERVRALASLTRAHVILYGYTSGLDLRASVVEAGPEGLNLTLVAGEVERTVRTRLIGFHNAYTILAAAAVALTRGLSLAEVAARLDGFAPLPGRLRPLLGPDRSTLIDDSQSSSPRSLAAALEALALFPQRKIAVLGQVDDLDSEHAQGDEAAPAQIAATLDLLITYGSQAERLGEMVKSWGTPPGRVIATDSIADAAAALQPLHLGDVVLIKGAESARMERLVERLLPNPALASRLLVRQSQGWKQRVFLSAERPTWIEIDLDAIAGNVERACVLAGPGRQIMAVLKADAYGHGAVRVARTAFLHGATMGAVACLSEAVTLREAGIRAPLLLLGYTPAWQAREIVHWGLSATVYELNLARRLSRAAVAAGAPPVPVHLKVDTGMSRLGVMPEAVSGLLAELRTLPGISVEGIFTHFATADEGPEDDLAQTQLLRFRALLASLRQEGHVFRYVHADNSAALINGLGQEFNLVRLGILTYGLDPSPRTPCPPGFRPALAFKTRVAQVKTVPVGACVSYGCRFVAQRPSTIAVIPVGYGDGFRRSPCNWGEVLVRGHRAPLAGTVCMDMTMLDVTDIPGVKEGDEVVLIGAQGEERISADDVARRLGTINYEVVTQILPRVPRAVP